VANRDWHEYGSEWFRAAGLTALYPTGDYSDPDPVSGAGSSAIDSADSSIIKNARLVVVHRLVYSNAAVTPANGSVQLLAHDGTTVIDTYETNITTPGAIKFQNIGIRWPGGISAITPSDSCIVSILYSAYF